MRVGCVKADLAGRETKMSQRTKPPFRADHVGSLLRPAALKDARAKLAKSEIAAAALKEVEDREIARVVRKQEEIGLELATDGEFRRSWGHFDFLWGLKGVEKISAPPIKFHGVDTKAEALKVTGKVDFVGHPQVEHFKFLKSDCKVTPKMCIPAPSTFHYQQGRAMLSREGYPGYDEYFADVAAAWRKAIRAFYDAGCRYLQLDDTAWAMICDPKEREGSKARGDDPDSLPAIYARVTNEALKDRPADMAITMHPCRGNFRSTFVASGGYEPVADTMFNGINVHGYFMEFDSARDGGFEPLREVPKDRQVVLGLVTTKTGALESKDDLKRRIDQAAKFIPLEQLCLSPQCGFASTEEGN